MEEDKLLERFMKEFFPYAEFKKAGIFTKEMRGDYKAQAERICKQLGLNTVFEYGKDEIRCHLTYTDPDCPGGMATTRPLSVDPSGELIPEPFVTIIPSIYE